MTIGITEIVFTLHIFPLPLLIYYSAKPVVWTYSPFDINTLLPANLNYLRYRMILSQYLFPCLYNILAQLDRLLNPSMLSIHVCQNGDVHWIFFSLFLRLPLGNGFFHTSVLLICFSQIDDCYQCFGMLVP